MSDATAKDAGRDFHARPIKSVGVIGLSSTGLPIAKRLSCEVEKAGLDKVLVFDNDKALLAKQTDGGLTSAKSIAHLVDSVDLILLCLSGDSEVGKAARSHEGLLDCIRQGQIIIDHSWSSLTLTRQLEVAFGARGAAFLDAPIARSVDVQDHIGAGCIDLNIAGDPVVIDAASAVLRGFADAVHLVGDVGSAQIVRQMDDLVALETFTALAEAMIAAGGVGVDADRLLPALAKRLTSNDLSRSGLAGMRGGKDHSSMGQPTIADACRRLEDAINIADGNNIRLDSASHTLARLREAVEGGKGGEGLGSLFSPKTQSMKARSFRHQRG